jgi:hypothetical protein
MDTAKNVQLGKGSGKYFSRQKFLLSRSATALYKSTPLPREVCNRVGQYLGTDIPFFQVGDIYVETCNRDDIRFKEVPEHHLQVGSSYSYFDVMLIYTYKVLRRTACMLKMELTGSYQIVFKGPSQRVHGQIPEIALITQHKESAITRTRPLLNGLGARVTKFKKLIAENRVFKISEHGDVEYNPETNEFVVEFGGEKKRQEAAMRRYIQRQAAIRRSRQEAAMRRYLIETIKSHNKISYHKT